MPCSKCGHNHPGEKCGSSPAVLQITNKDCTLFHGVTVPAIMGGETENPPKNGLYKNVLLYYEATGNAYFYTSDGIPYKLTYATTDYNALTNKPTVNGVTLEGNKTAANLGIVVNDGTLTLKQGGTTLGTFSANASENVEINTKNSYVIALREGYRLNFNGIDIGDPAEAMSILSSAKAEEIKLADFPSAVCYYSNGGRILNFIRGTAESGEASGPGAMIDTISLNNDGTYDIWSGNVAFQGELVLQFLYMGDTFYPTGTWQLNNLNPILASRVEGTTPYDFLSSFLLSTQNAKGYVRAASYGITGEGLLLGEAYYDTVGGEYVLVAELMSLRHQEIYSIAFKPDETYTVISRYRITTNTVPE